MIVLDLESEEEKKKSVLLSADVDFVVSAPAAPPAFCCQCKFSSGRSRLASTSMLYKDSNFNL